MKVENFGSVTRPPVPPVTPVNGSNGVTNRLYTSETSHTYTCDTCVKSDVCSIKTEFMKAVKDIDEVSGRTNVFITTRVRCNKYINSPCSPRGFGLGQENRL